MKCPFVKRPLAPEPTAIWLIDQAKQSVVVNLYILTLAELSRRTGLNDKLLRRVLRPRRRQEWGGLDGVFLIPGAS